MANWYMQHGKTEVGPGSEDQLRAAFEKGKVTKSTKVRKEDSAGWVKLGSTGILDQGVSDNQGILMANEKQRLIGNMRFDWVDLLLIFAGMIVVGAFFQSLKKILGLKLDSAGSGGYSLSPFLWLLIFMGPLLRRTLTKRPLPQH